MMSLCGAGRVRSTGIQLKFPLLYIPVIFQAIESITTSHHYHS